MKYVPVFRYRESEKKVLDAAAISNKVLPLIEIVQQKRKVNMKASCFDDIKSFLKTNNTKVLVDFPLYIKFKPKSIASVRSFIAPLQANQSLRLGYFQQLAGENIIPVATYNPNTPLYTAGSLATEMRSLRGIFGQIAIRIFANHAQQALNEGGEFLEPGDLILVDIDEANHNDPAFTSFFSYINAYSKKYKCKSVLIRAALGPGITNTGLTGNGAIVRQLDNSLLQDYTGLGFDAFGDYCGIKKDELLSGGMSSPGCIFYHWWTNAYYGHKGIYSQPDTFTSMVLPSLTNSTEWLHFRNRSASHHSTCPGCIEINTILRTGLAGDSAPKWKSMISSHYLHTMEEFL